jgi:outer membrane protein assembly factor BamB
MAAMHSMTTLTRLALTALAAAALAIFPAEPAAVGGNWAQWRGPGGQGVSAEPNLAEQWSPTTNVAWKTALAGRGHSSPIVWEDRIFLTTDEEGPVVDGARAATHMVQGKPFVHPDSVGADRRHTMKVVALDARSGRALWERTAYEGTVYDDRHKRSSYASPTPVTDGRRVYAYFGPEGVFCYDFDGALVWKASVGKFGTLGLGTGTSPVLYENLLILQRDEDGGEESFIVALDKDTGKEVWKTSRKVQVSWSTPVLVQAEERIELVTSGNELIVAYDPRTGKELWRTRGLRSHAIHTPLVGEGLVILTSGFPSKRIIAIEPGGSGDITGTPHIVWTYDKGTAYVVSPILYDGLVYLVADNGILTCLDAKTGEVKYEGGRPPVPARFMASPVAAMGRIFLTSEDGDTFVIKAGPVHEVLRTNSVGEPVFSSLAIANGRIYVRGERHLFAIGG